MFRTLVITTLLLFVTPQIMAAADDSRDGGQFCARTFDGRRVNIYNAEFREDEIRGTGKDGSPVAVSRNDIFKLQKYNGNHARTGLVTGGVVGLIVFVWAVNSTRNDYNNQIDGPRVIPILFGSVGGGVLLGLTIGALIPSWTDIGLEEDWSRMLSMQQTRPTLSFTLRF